MKKLELSSYDTLKRMIQELFIFYQETSGPLKDSDRPYLSFSFSDTSREMALSVQATGSAKITFGNGGVGRVEILESLATSMVAQDIVPSDISPSSTPPNKSSAGAGKRTRHSRDT